MIKSSVRLYMTELELTFYNFGLNHEKRVLLYYIIWDILTVTYHKNSCHSAMRRRQPAMVTSQFG